MHLREKLEAVLESTREQGFYGYAEAEAVAAAAQEIANAVLGQELELKRPDWWASEKQQEEG